MYDQEVAALAKRVASEDVAAPSGSSGAYPVDRVDGGRQGAAKGRSAVDAFSEQAEDLGQAVQQKEERDEFVGSRSSAREDTPGGGEERSRVKDEL